MYNLAQEHSLQFWKDTIANGDFENIDWPNERTPDRIIGKKRNEALHGSATAESVSSKRQKTVSASADASSTASQKTPSRAGTNSRTTATPSGPFTAATTSSDTLDNGLFVSPEPPHPTPETETEPVVIKEEDPEK